MSPHRLGRFSLHLDPRRSQCGHPDFHHGLIAGATVTGMAGAAGKDPTSRPPDPPKLGPVVGRPMRVVVLGGGPYLERGVVELLGRLDREPEVDLAAAFFELREQSRSAFLRDLWRRRRWLAGPVLLAQGARALARAIQSPARALERRRRLRSLAPLLHRVPDLHESAFLDRLRALDCDLGIVYGGPILKAELFEIPRFGYLGIHHGKLPGYRGKKTTFWEMAAGEVSAGVTVQRIGRGLDTGAIVEQGEVPIGRRPYRAVWNDVEELGVELLLEAVSAVRRGSAEPSFPQGPKGPLFRDPELRDLLRFQWQRLTRRR